VDSAAIFVGSRKISSIEKGVLVFLGVECGDDKKDADYLLDKVINLRIFEDEMGKMNLSLLDKSYAMLVVSQFIYQLFLGLRNAWFGSCPLLFPGWPRRLGEAVQLQSPPGSPGTFCQIDYLVIWFFGCFLF
jgi:hypothetical protein